MHSWGARVLVLVGVFVVILGLGLTVVVLFANPGSWPAAAFLELLAAMTWIALFTSAPCVAGLLPALVIVGWLWPTASKHRGAFFVAGLIGLHAGWALFNRLQLPQLWVLPPRLLTWDGALQLAGIAAVVPITLVAGVLLGARRCSGGFAAAATAAGLSLALLAWNADGENRWQRVTLNEALAAARAGSGDTAPSDTATRGPVIALGIDGLSWNVLTPLMRAGRLPHISELVRNGALAYLDNGSDSFSPRIWNTIWSGRPPSEHGVYGFLKVVLPRSGHEIRRLPAQYPAVDVVFGLRQLLRRVPSLGLWEIAFTDSRDLLVKRVWDVASEYGKRVAVSNPLNLTPVSPVNGAIISFKSARLDETTVFPPTAATGFEQFPRGAFARSLEDWPVALKREVPFTVALFEKQRVELGVYYTEVLDVISHGHWNFYGRGSILLRDLPRDWSPARWEQEIVGSADAPAFAGYFLTDEIMERFTAAFPNAIFVICSDHGWSYSGFQHWNSPDGVLIISGPGVRAGTILEGAHIRDVTPTLLALLGVPLSDEFAGAPLGRAFDHLPPVSRVASYGAPKRRAGPAKLADEETLRRLEALGYIQ